MKIKIKLSRDSVDEAITQVKAYRRNLPNKTEEILTKLANMGKQIVDFRFSLTGEEYDVSCIVNGNNAMIIATGDNVVFLEFGTGVGVIDKTEEFGMETAGLPPIYSGSWSETEGSGVFARHGYWHYNGHFYAQTMATQGFYFASKEIRDKAVEEAKRVFKK